MNLPKDIVVMNYSLADLKEHTLNHIQENEKEINFLGESELKVLEAHELLENIMAMATNIGKEMSFPELSKHCENLFDILYIYMLIKSAHNYPLQYFLLNFSFLLPSVPDFFRSIISN